jgi:hypothetical protein
MSQYDPNRNPQQPFTTDSSSAGPASSFDAILQWARSNLTIVAAGGIFIVMCILGMCVLLFVIFRGPSLRVPPPATAGPTLAILNTPSIILTPIPQQPTFSPGLVGQLLNPYVAAGLNTMVQVSVDVYNPLTGQFENKLLALGETLNPFIEGFNIGAFIEAPDPSCQDRARITVGKADTSQVIFSMCFRRGTGFPEAVLRSSALASLGGGDLNMGPYFVDVLKPYLPFDLLQQIGAS